MNINKFLLGTLVGGIVYFFLGYLVYGVAMADFFKNHSMSPAGTMKPMSDIIWWALILGNLASGALLTFIFLKLGNVNSFSKGASMGAAIGFFTGLGMDLIRYATENGLNRRATLVDVLLGVVMTAITGGIIAVVLGMGTKKS